MILFLGFYGEDLLLSFYIEVNEKQVISFNHNHKKCSFLKRMWNPFWIYAIILKMYELKDFSLRFWDIFSSLWCSYVLFWISIEAIYVYGFSFGDKCFLYKCFVEFNIYVQTDNIKKTDDKRGFSDISLWIPHCWTIFREVYYFFLLGKESETNGLLFSLNTLFFKS